MKLKLNTRTNRGFTLIEMIGVLAVIAILAALLIPKVFQAITEAKLNTVPVACATIKTAAIDHYAKYGSLDASPTVGTPYAVGEGYDLKLLAEGLIDKPFAPRVGTAPAIGMVAAEGAVVVNPATPASYGLSGTGADGVVDDPATPADETAAATIMNEAVGSRVIYAKLETVPVADAQAISARIDGASMSSPETNPGKPDLRGRVKYSGGTGTTTVFVYLTHR